MAAHFKDLTCWQLSNELKIAVYSLTQTEAAQRDRSFCDDMRRAARSAPANIAEGFGRYTHREFARFLTIARASVVETENHLQHALDAGFITSEESQRLVALAQQTQRAISGLRRYLVKGTRGD